MLQLVDACRQRLGAVARQHGALGLQERLSVVVVLVHEVDGDPAVGASRSQHGLVDMVPVHPLAAELRQQRRVDVEDALGVGLQPGLSDEDEVARQDDQLDA